MHKWEFLRKVCMVDKLGKTFARFVGNLGWGMFARMVIRGKICTLGHWGLEVSTEGSLGEKFPRKVIWEKVNKFVSRLVYIFYLIQFVGHVLFERVIDVSGENNINSAFSIGGGNQCHEKTAEFQPVIDLLHHTMLCRIHGRKTTISNLI